MHEDGAPKAAAQCY